MVFAFSMSHKFHVRKRVRREDKSIRTGKERGTFFKVEYVRKGKISKFRTDFERLFFNEIDDRSRFLSV